MLHKITFMLTLLLLTPVLTARGAADTETASPIPFTIHTHGVALTEEDVKAVLDEAQNFLEVNDGVHISFDFSHSFDSNHKVIDDGKISGCLDIRALLKTKDVNVHIVDDIPCCDDPMEAKKAGDNTGRDKIVGCSGPKMAMIVRPVDRPDLLHLTAIQWMHELGHHKGLCHNTCDDDGSIMSNPPGFTNDSLDECERLVFNGGVPSDPICMSSKQSCRPTGPTCSGTQQ